ncbi:MAG: hypothetical protein U0269_22510 [Polyangiales bacterium]
MSDEPPIVTIQDALIARRPEGTARAMGRATMGLLIVMFVLAFIANVAVRGAAAPAWISVPLGLLFMLAIAMFAATSLTQIWSWIAPKMQGTLSASARGAQLTHRLGGAFVEREEIDSAWVVRDGSQPVVELRTKNGNVISTHVRTEDEAQRLLDVLGIAPDQRATSMLLGSPMVSAMIAVGSLVPSSCVGAVLSLAIAQALSLPSAAMGFMMFALTAAGMPLALKLLAPPRVHVGNDGVSVGDGDAQRFYAFSDLQSVRATRTALRLTLRDGRTATIPSIGTSAPRLDALVARITDGIANPSGPRALSDRLALLDRAGRTIVDWEKSLRTVLDEGSAYRASGLTRQELLDVLDDPQAPEERRIAAAFVLSLHSAGAPNERVRVAIESTAQEHVRVALERASQGTLDEPSIDAASATRVRVGE